jgi:radical SAM protein with 4Fe4S-binding SPASM domain
MAVAASVLPVFDPEEHYLRALGPTHEFGSLPETPPSIRNIGWTLGNDCPYRCTHCYSMSARRKGRNMTRGAVERVVEQLAANGVETVNLGGNEPLFTNGPRPADTLLPYIIEKLRDAGIEVGLTTSGISLLYLYREARWAFEQLNDVDVSFDSPFEDEHNRNRGARLYQQAEEALRLCQEADKPHTVIMAGMSWNFSPRHVRELVALAARYGAHVRINPVKPVEPHHMNVALPPDLYYSGFALLFSLCDPVDLGEPPLAAVTNFQHARRCPCGRTSFRIHSITPEGRLFVSPCVYLHDYKSTLDLLEHDLKDIIDSPQFRVFRQRNANPDRVKGCAGCGLLAACGGGCTARSYLHQVHTTAERTMLARDPYCPVEMAPAEIFPQRPELVSEHRLVHMDYLCTWIGKPREGVGGPACT